MSIELLAGIIFAVQTMIVVFCVMSISDMRPYMHKRDLVRFALGQVFWSAAMLIFYAVILNFVFTYGA